MVKMQVVRMGRTWRSDLPVRETAVVGTLSSSSGTSRGPCCTGVCFTVCATRGRQS